MSSQTDVRVRRRDTPFFQPAQATAVKATYATERRSSVLSLSEASVEILLVGGWHSKAPPRQVPPGDGALRAHRKRQAEERLAWGPLWTGADADLVFVEEDGSPIHPQRLTRYFEARVTKAGLPHIAFHGLRHSYVNMLLRGGQPLRAVSARVGHASANVTNVIYSHVLPGNDEQAALAGAALLGG